MSSKEKKKRTRSRAWFFTYNNPHKDAVGTLMHKFSNIKYVFQLERGESGTVHLQGCVRYKHPRENWPEIEIEWAKKINWKRCRNWRASIRYCTKVATRIDGPWTNIKGLTWRATIEDPLKDKEYYPWQKEIVELVQTKPDERTIYWYYDTKGCCGKTSLAKHLKIKYLNKLLYANGNSKDVLCGLKFKLESHDVKVIIFGLTRGDEYKVSYKALEIVKDGIGFSGKYESGDFLINPPHVIVFANFEPDTNMLSKDRWKIVEIK